MDKLIRNINEQLWRDAKTVAALEGLSIKDMIEEIIVKKLSLNQGQCNAESNVAAYLDQHNQNTTKIIRGINPDLWRMVKAQAALEGRSMKDWVEINIAQGLIERKKDQGNINPQLPAGPPDKNTEKTKILRSVNEQLWREAKARAAREGKTMKEWVEQTVKIKLSSDVSNNENLIGKYREHHNSVKTKILRNIDEDLWREAKARSAMEGKTMKEWVEGCIAAALTVKGVQAERDK